MLRIAHRPGDVTYRATIMVGVGTDESVGETDSREFDAPQAARAWIEQHLPTATLPDWAADYPHHGGGVFLWGWVQAGYYNGNSDGSDLASDADWEPDFAAASLDADLVNGRVRWRHS